MKSFGKRLQELRLARGMTQKDLARMLDVQLAVISRYERGLSAPSAASIIELAKILQVTTDEILIGQPGGVEPPVIRNAVFFERFKKLDTEIDDRKDIEAIVTFLDAFLARKQLKRMAASA